MNNLSQKNGKLYEVYVIHSLLILLFLVIPVRSTCQGNVSDTKNTISIEGSSLVFIGGYSVCYERVMLASANYKLNINAGLGGWYFFPVSRAYYGYSVPFTFNNLIGSGNNYFEVDLGMRYTFIKEKIVQSVPETDANYNEISRFFPVINIGYRYQRPDARGLIFRSFIGLSGIGIGIGKAF